MTDVAEISESDFVKGAAGLFSDKPAPQTNSQPSAAPEPAAPASVPESPVPSGTDDPAPAEAPASVESGKEIEQAPVIDPPVSWPEEFKSRFRDLPPDVQRLVADREGDRERYFSQKAQETAEKIRLAETELSATRNLRDQYAQGLAFQQQQLDAGIKQWEKVDWFRLNAENPVECQKQRIAYEEALRSRNAVISERQQIAFQQQVETTNRKEQFRAQNETELVRHFPHWKDIERGRKDLTAIQTTLSNHYGFKPEELAELWDHRVIRVAHDAWQYRQLQAAKANVVKKVGEAPKVLQPGAARESPGTNERIAQGLANLKRNSGKGESEKAAFVALLTGR